MEVFRISRSTKFEGYFHDYVCERKREGRLIIQPRMGFSSLNEMREGLSAVASFGTARIGSLTVDSFTRQGFFGEVAEAIGEGRALNGYPIVTYGREVNTHLLAGLLSREFPVQVRHGCPLPFEIFRAAAEAGIDAIEGGPVSYCLPYGRVRLKDSFAAWGEACAYWAERSGPEGKGHVESFAGCMMGQLCPPALLIALGVLEGLFFRQHGIRSISLSYSQGTNSDQDIGAVVALRQLAEEFLPESLSHIVFYSFMGLFPSSYPGARALIEESARVAVLSGAARLIVKTSAEPHAIPTIKENIEAMSWAHEASQRCGRSSLTTAALAFANDIYEEAKNIVTTILNLKADLVACMLEAFRLGILDIPFCLHRDNHNIARAYIGEDGVNRWRESGNVPTTKGRRPARAVRAEELLTMLSFNRRRFSKTCEA